MQETEQVNRAEAFHRKLDETKRRAFDEEVARLEKETEQRGTALAKMLQLKDNHLFEELTKEAETSRQREKELLKKRESDIRTRLKDEHARKRMRRVEEERLRREEAEEQKSRELQQKEESARNAEEERRRWEEQLRRQEEEQLRMIEAERRQREDENRKTAEEARRKTEAAQRKSEEENQIAQMRQQREQEELANAEAARWQREQEEERIREEEAMRLQREEFRRKEEERVKREAEEKVLQAELRRQEEENFRRQEEENRKREEEDRVRREAEEKVRLEEELRRQVEERHREAEEHKRRQAEESVRIEQERQAKESGSREGRIRELVTNAEGYFNKGDFEHALVEVAKALVNDPSNGAAIQLEKKIKEAQGVQNPQEQEETAPARKRKHRELKPQFETREKKKSIFSRPLVVAGAVVVVAILVFAGLQLKKKIFSATTTVAIQPWTGSSNNPEDLVIGSSLAEEVAKQFQQYKKSSVMGYASAFGISRSDSRPQALFGMGASHILQGTVTKSALGVSVNVKLVDSVGNSKWSEHYDRTLATLPTLPAEIATKLAEVLDLPRDRAYAPMTTTSNGDAYGNYLRGIELLHHRSAANLRSASDLLRQSAEADPSFVQALSAASICLSTMAEENWVPFDSGVGAARDYAEKAIKANSAMGDGYVALGRVFTLFRDYPNAAEQYTLALKYSPASSAAYVGRGKNYLRLAKYKDAIDAFAKAYELDPRDPDVLSSLGFAYQLSGNPEQGAQYHQTALSFVSDSTDYLIGPVCDAILLDPDLSMSQSARVISACEHRIVQNPDDYATIYRLSRTLQVTGKRIEGTTLLDKLETVLRGKLKTNPSNANAMIYLALTLTRMGRFPEATMWGQKAYELNSNDAVTCFRLAQMYSLQMYSSQRKKTDDKKKEEATKALKQALRISYRVDELANADFYNMYEHGDFLSVISANPK